MRLVSPGMRRLAIVLWIVAVALLPLALVGSGPTGILWAILPSVFTAFFAWAVLWRPGIVAGAEALVVVDVRRTSTYAWPRVAEIRTRHGLEIVTNEGVRRTWIAPSGRSRLARPGGAARLDLDAAVDGMRAFAPEPVRIDGPPPATVVAAPIVHRIHGWTVVALIVLGLAASVTGARI